MAQKEKKFEEMLAELEALVAEMETVSMPLEDMVEHIERGSKLVLECQKRLNVLNSKVEMIFKDDGAQGEFKSFDPTVDRSMVAQSEIVPPQSAPKDAGSSQDELPF